MRTFLPRDDTAHLCSGLVYCQCGVEKAHPSAAAIKKQIAAKQTEYDNLMRNLSSSTFASEIVADINRRMTAIREEITVLENTDPPEEYTADTIIRWLQSIKAAPDKRTVHLLIERIEVSSDNEKTDIKVTSTLMSVVDLVAAIRFERMTDRV